MFRSLKILLEKIFMFARFGHQSEFTPEQEQYLKHWSDRERYLSYALYDKAAPPFYLVAAMLSAFVAVNQIMTGMIASLLVGVTEIFLWNLFFRRIFSASLKVALVIRAVLGVLFIIAIYGFLFGIFVRSAEVSPSDYVQVGLITGIFMILYISLAVTALGSLIFVFTGLLAITSLLVSLDSGMTRAWVPFLGIVIVGSAISGTYYMELLIRRKQALLEWDAQQLATQNERLRLQGIEKELEIAHKLHNAVMHSFKPVRVGNRRVDFFQQPYGLLGGDWLGVRSNGDGELVIAVGDITGKGIPAAMIAQSVESLWAASLDQGHFEPAAWLASLNGTLCEMGRRDAHTLTLGLLTLTATSAYYFSAGHLPLYLIEELDDEHSITPIVAEGPMLGLAREVHFEPRELRFKADGAETLLLGTDGILSWQMRKNRKRILSMVKNVMANGQEALHSMGTNDDQILVMVQGGHPSLQRATSYQRR